MTTFANRVLALCKRGLAIGLAGGAMGLSATAATPDEAHAFDCLSPDPAQWPAPAKPYFMIGFDTSGSMDTALTTAPSCAGYPLTRSGHGRCAIKNTLLAFSGIANFGLASYAFAMTSCPAGTCSNTFNTCSFAPFTGDSAGAGCSGGCGPEPGPMGDSSTRRGGAILVPMRVDSAPPTLDNTASLVQWVDNDCTGAKELFTEGCTPMNGILRDMYRYYANQWVAPSPVPGTGTFVSPLTSVANGERPCRSVNVIFVTDGAETCDTLANAVDAAGDLFAGFVKDGITWKVKTFVIDFGDAGNEADQIAAAGGTVAAKHATNEEELAAALADIISKSVAPEVCDNTDNNCNNCIDEGWNKYCNVGQNCCAWGTQAQRTTCLNNYKASINPGDPDGDLTFLPCTTVQQQTESANWLCFDPKEICDEVNNNCQGGVDEGVVKCGNPAHCPQAETCNSQDDDCDGLTDEGVCSGCIPEPEDCDGCDDDCDGFTDNGVNPVACGLASPPNCAGQLICKPPVAVPIGTCAPGGGFLACNNNPQAEVCDMVDNDCDGIVDDGVPATSCVPVGAPPGLVYGAPSQCVLGQQPCNGVCGGWVGPSAEICDGIDNDCDGVVDDSAFGVGQPCGNNTPPCSPGATACVNGALVCQGGVGPQSEVCDGVDNDCDGGIDDAVTDAPAPGANGCWLNPGNCCTFKNLSWCPPAGASCNDVGTLTPPCNKGTLVCAGAAGWSCQSPNPPSPEVCDSIDNNCNGAIDDGVPTVGQMCGTSTGECTSGTIQCAGGVLDCVGDVGPATETCDGLDNDCDGAIDESIPGTGVPCGNNTPPCSQGVTACVGGMVICQGGTQPQTEVCDAIDNDCDAQIDEGPLGDAPPAGMTGCWSQAGNCCTFDGFSWCPPAGATCSGSGMLTSPCGTGQLVCQGGGWTCQNAKPPTPEACDGIDNDCDGAVDDVAAVQCDPPGAPPGTVYGGTSQCMKGTQSCGACVGAVGPSQEVCDGIDNDCDGVVDDSVVGGGVPCGNSTPPCTAGMTACVNGALVCQGGTLPGMESCDGIDNDCDGAIDDAPLTDAPAAGMNGCWNEPGNCCTHDGFSWCPPAGATCGGNGTLLAPCGKGQLTCTSGAWTCQNANTPNPEICDGLDNDCDGNVDDVTPVTCNPPGAPPGTVYGGTSQCKQGMMTCGACAGAVGPSAEICDGIDNDCDGNVDEAIVGVGGPCGINQPPCTPGTTACLNGAIVCQGGMGPQPEMCDGIDNDCNGMPDNPPLADAPAAGQNGCWNEPGNCCTFKNLVWCPPPGGTCTDNGGLMPPCNKGTITCAGAGGWVCQGPKPPVAEACDGLDNDCNGSVDDATFPQEGEVCGSDIGECIPGLIQCAGGVLDCVGDQGPTQETCDGLDNDCEGNIDNGVQDGGPCEFPYDKIAYPGPRDKGVCQPGQLICNGMGGYVCIGGVGPSPEQCDGIDNDCDGQTDEIGAQPDGINGSSNPFPPPVAKIGDACGSDVGVCLPGQYGCLNGSFACIGGVGATPEECDCDDNNCDGANDNPPPGGQICSPGKQCVKSPSSMTCNCAAPCGPDENPCPPGQKCEVVTSSETGDTLGKFCTPDYDILCGACETKTASDGDGNVICAPAGTPEDANCVAPPVCVCKGPNGCKDPCFNKTCDAGKVCSSYGPKAGQCVINNCYNAPCLGCGKACHEGTCVDNPCTANSCQPGEVCKPNAGWTGVECVPSCADVMCPMGQVCIEGACTPTCDPACPADQVCDTTQSPPVCINDQCMPNPCLDGAYCDPITGSCVDDPCAGVLCPDNQACMNGDCFPDTSGTGGAGGGSASATSSVTSSASASASGGGVGGAGGVGGGPVRDDGTWGLPTGGGGCACEVGPGARAAREGGALAAIALAIAAARLRRRRGARPGRGEAEVSR
jgi:MYXO-CTERM domain-containing protein